MRDENSTTYVSAIETAEEFGLRVYTEAWNRGWDRASIRVVMGDGSHWIWNIADQHFPGAIQIVDLYMPASTSGIWLANCIRPTKPPKSAG